MLLSAYPERLTMYILTSVTLTVNYDCILDLDGSIWSNDLCTLQCLTSQLYMRATDVPKFFKIIQLTMKVTKIPFQKNKYTCCTQDKREI